MNVRIRNKLDCFRPGPLAVTNFSFPEPPDRPSMEAQKSCSPKAETRWWLQAALVERDIAMRLRASSPPPLHAPAWVLEPAADLPQGVRRGDPGVRVAAAEELHELGPRGGVLAATRPRPGGTGRSTERPAARRSDQPPSSDPPAPSPDSSFPQRAGVRVVAMCELSRCGRRAGYAGRRRPLTYLQWVSSVD